MRDLLPRSQILVGFSEAAKSNGSPDPATRRDSLPRSQILASFSEVAKSNGQSVLPNRTRDSTECPLLFANHRNVHEKRS